MPARVTHSLELSGRVRGLLLSGSEENAARTAEAILSGWGFDDVGVCVLCSEPISYCVYAGRYLGLCRPKTRLFLLPITFLPYGYINQLHKCKQPTPQPSYLTALSMYNHNQYHRNGVGNSIIQAIVRSVP